MEDISIRDKDVWMVRVEYRIVKMNDDVIEGVDVFPCIYGVDRMIPIISGLLGIRMSDIKRARVVIEL